MFVFIVCKGNFGCDQIKCSLVLFFVLCLDMCGVVVESKFKFFKNGICVIVLFYQIYFISFMKESDLDSGFGMFFDGVLIEYCCFFVEVLVKILDYFFDVEVSCLLMVLLVVWLSINGIYFIGDVFLGKK